MQRAANALALLLFSCLSVTKCDGADTPPPLTQNPGLLFGAEPGMRMSI